MRAQNAEIAKELVDATNEAGQCRNEVKGLKERIKKLQNEVAAMEAQMQLKEQEIADTRND